MQDCWGLNRGCYNGNQGLYLNATEIEQRACFSQKDVPSGESKAAGRAGCPCMVCGTEWHFYARIFLLSIFTCAVSSGACENCLCEQHAYCHQNPLTGKPTEISCLLESFTCASCQSKPFLAVEKKRHFQRTCCATKVVQKVKPGAK